MKLTKYLAVLLILLPCNLVAVQQHWKSLINDGVHDPTSPAIGILQEPSQAFSLLPADTAGNKVSWGRALREQYIQPRTNIFPETKINVLDMDIIMDRTGEMPMVRFPHKAHTEWLDCENCHDDIFIEIADANPVNMFAILAGEYCGRCHGAVAFPLTECNRCHSVDRNTFTGQPGAQPEKDLTDMLN